MTIERWLSIPGANGHDVSDLGRVRSWLPWRGQPVPRILKGVLAINGGYPCVRLKLDGKSQTAYVHRLVLLAFVGPLPAGNQTRHLDGNCQNNTLRNLAYGTPSENMQDNVRNGTHHNTRKTHCRHGHPFSEENTYLLTSRGSVERQCRTCKKRNRAESRSRQSGVAA